MSSLASRRFMDHCWLVVCTGHRLFALGFHSLLCPCVSQFVPWHTRVMTSQGGWAHARLRPEADQPERPSSLSAAATLGSLASFLPWYTASSGRLLTVRPERMAQTASSARSGCFSCSSLRRSSRCVFSRTCPAPLAASWTKRLVLGLAGIGTLFTLLEWLLSTQPMAPQAAAAIARPELGRLRFRDPRDRGPLVRT